MGKCPKVSEYVFHDGQIKVMQNKNKIEIWDAPLTNY